MCEFLNRLRPNQRRGSKPRCHGLSHGSREAVAERLTLLISPWGTVSPSDHWKPGGFDDVEEARLERARELIPGGAARVVLRDWWLTVHESANTPNWDITSTCKVGDCPGLLLVEAKAHAQELRVAEGGKPCNDEINSRRNHARIGWCIEDASLVLSAQTGLNWTLSRDSRYQMANRFAWAWKLTELGFPVILVYLGFLNAEEMRDEGTPLTETSWPSLVRAHSKSCFPAEVWDRQWTVNHRSFIPLIKTLEQSLCCAGETGIDALPTGPAGSTPSGCGG